MKNILEILKELGLEVPADKQEALNKAVTENYKTSAEFEKTKTKLETEKNGVEEQGTHDELLAKGGIYAELWNVSLKV